MTTVPPPRHEPASSPTLWSCVAARTAVSVHAREALELAAVEVGVVVVAARLEHDHVEARRGQHGRRRAAAGARADDADVAVELGVALTSSGVERLGRRVGRAPSGPG